LSLCPPLVQEVEFFRLTFFPLFRGRGDRFTVRPSQLFCFRTSRRIVSFFPCILLPFCRKCHVCFPPNCHFHGSVSLIPPLLLPRCCCASMFSKPPQTKPNTSPLSDAYSTDEVGMPVTGFRGAVFPFATFDSTVVFFLTVFPSVYDPFLVRRRSLTSSSLSKGGVLFLPFV